MIKTYVDHEQIKDNNNRNESCHQRSHFFLILEMADGALSELNGAYTRYIY